MSDERRDRIEAPWSFGDKRWETVWLSVIVSCLVSVFSAVLLALAGGRLVWSFAFGVFGPMLGVGTGTHAVTRRVVPPGGPVGPMDALGPTDAMSYRAPPVRRGRCQIVWPDREPSYVPFLLGVLVFPLALLLCASTLIVSRSAQPFWLPGAVLPVVAYSLGWRSRRIARLVVDDARLVRDWGGLPPWGRTLEVSSGEIADVRVQHFIYRVRQERGPAIDADKFEVIAVLTSGQELSVATHLEDKWEAVWLLRTLLWALGRDVAVAAERTG